MPSRYYIYAIAERGSALPPQLSGLGGSPVAAIAWRELTAVSSKLDSTAVAVTREHLVAHEAVVETVRLVAPALPVRFGTVLPDVEAVRRALAEHYDVLRADLARLGDKVEMGLTALFPAADAGTDAASETSQTREDDSSGPGTRYLRGRMAHYRQEITWRKRAEELTASLEQALGGRAIESRRTLLPGPPPIVPTVRAAFLVAPSEVGAFRDAFEALRVRLPGVRLLLSGPWPPYSFVTQPRDALHKLSNRLADESTHVRIKEEEP